MIVYTFPIVDVDGEITGEPGAIIVLSHALQIVPFKSAEVGQAVVDWPGGEPEVFAIGEFYGFDGRRFRHAKTTMERKPHVRLGREEVELADVWERIQ